MAKKVTFLLSWFNFFFFSFLWLLKLCFYFFFVSPFGIHHSKENNLNFSLADKRWWKTPRTKNPTTECSDAILDLEYQPVPRTWSSPLSMNNHWNNNTSSSRVINHSPLYSIWDLKFNFFFSGDTPLNELKFGMIAILVYSTGYRHAKKTK